MNGIGKIFFGTVAFSLGAVAGYYACKKHLEEQYRMDVDDIQTFYNEKLEEFGVMDSDSYYEHLEDEELESYEDEEYDEDPEYNEEDERMLTSYRNDKRRVVVDYTKPSLETMQKVLQSEGVTVIVDSNNEENLGQIDDEDYDEYEDYDDYDEEYERELEEMAEDYARRRSENMKNGDPYLIEPEEYAEGPEDYDRQALYYYSHDRVLCEDNDIQVEDEEGCVGFDYEDKLDMQTTAWVRNDKLRVLYEIHRIDESYQKTVLNIVETPREREFRIQGRRKQAMDDQFESRKS